MGGGRKLEAHSPPRPILHRIGPELADTIFDMKVAWISPHKSGHIADVLMPKLAGTHSLFPSQNLFPLQDTLENKNNVSRDLMKKLYIFKYF